MGRVGHRNLPLLHGFQQGGLNFRGRAIDLIRKDDVGEDRPRLENEALLGILLIALTFRLDRRREQIKPGTAFYLILLLYFVARFLVEFVKEQ